MAVQTAVHNCTGMLHTPAELRAAQYLEAMAPNSTALNDKQAAS